MWQFIGILGIIIILKAIGIKAIIQIILYISGTILIAYIISLIVKGINEKNGNKTTIIQVYNILENKIEITIDEKNLFPSLKNNQTLEQLITDNLESLTHIDMKNPPILKKGDYESTKDFEYRVRLEKKNYQFSIDKQIKNRDKYLSILNDLKQNGYKESIYEKIFGKKDKEIYISILNLYVKSIRTYYQNPCIENLLYDADLKELTAILKFKSLLNYSQNLLFKNILPNKAKSIIEDKKYIIEVSFITDINSIELYNVFLIDSQRNKAELSKKDVLQKTPLSISINKIDFIQKPIEINIDDNTSEHEQNSELIDLMKILKSLI